MIKSVCAATALMAFVSLPVSAQQAKQFNTRAYMCDAIEFAELNSLEFEWLEQMYCSAGAGAKRALDRFNGTSDTNVNSTIVTGRSSVALSDRCMKTMRVSGDIARRKFPDRKFSCADYK